MKTARNSVLILLILLVYSSCTVKKRAYRKGYYIEYSKHLSHTDQTKKQKETQPIEEDSEAKLKSHYAEPMTDFASGEDPYASLLKPNERRKIYSEECNDIIVMKNGDEVKAKVIEINETEVKYKLCDNIEGPLVIANKSNVFMIKYSNGSKEILANESAQKKTEKGNQTRKDNGKPKVEGNVITGLVFSILAVLLFFAMIPLFLTAISADLIAAFLAILFFIVAGATYSVFTILGLVFSAIGLNKIKQDPEKHTGKNLAVVSIILVLLSIIGLIIMAANIP